MLSPNTVKKNGEALVVASKKIGLEVNADKTKCMVKYRDQNAGQSHSTKIDISSFEWVEKLKYLEKDQNCIQEEIKSRLKSGNACYHLVQNVLSCSLLSKNIKIKIHRIIILPDVFYGCATWSHILREEGRLKVIEHRVLRRIFGPMRDEVTG